MDGHFYTRRHSSKEKNMVALQLLVHCVQVSQKGRYWKVYQAYSGKQSIKGTPTAANTLQTLAQTVCTLFVLISFQKILQLGTCSTLKIYDSLVRNCNCKISKCPDYSCKAEGFAKVIWAPTSICMSRLDCCLRQLKAKMPNYLKEYCFKAPNCMCR